MVSLITNPIQEALKSWLHVRGQLLVNTISAGLFVLAVSMTKSHLELVGTQKTCANMVQDLF